jgi:hypothetical protein
MASVIASNSTVAGYPKQPGAPQTDMFFLDLIQNSAITIYSVIDSLNNDGMELCTAIFFTLEKNLINF